MINIDLNATHHVVAASKHYYEKPTEELYIDRTLAFHDIIYLVEGEWLFTENINGKDVDYLLKPNDFLMLSAGNHHYTRFPCETNTKTYCIHITKEKNDMSESATDLMSMEHHINCSNNPKIIYYIKKITESFWDNGPYSQHSADAYTTLLLCELAKMNSKHSYSEAVQNVINMINNNPQNSFAEKDYVNASGLPIKKIAALFKKEVGQTLHAYHIGHKLGLIALHLETEPDILLKELAVTYGFYDEFYLSKMFKKKYGDSPNNYKKNIKKERPGIIE